MSVPDTARIDAAPVEIAPDGSRVHPLLALASGSMAQFELDGGQVSRAVRHRSVEEIWLVLSGRGEIWRHPSHPSGNHVQLDIFFALKTSSCLAYKSTRYKTRAMHIAHQKRSITDKIDQTRVAL